MTDGLGNPIDVGSFVAYVWRHSSSCGFAIGQVAELADGKLKVWGLDWRGNLNQRVSTLERLDRVIVLSEGQVPEKMRRALGRPAAAAYQAENDAALLRMAATL